MTCRVGAGHDKRTNIGTGAGRQSRWSEEPGGEIVMLGNDSLEVLQDRKEQECYC